MEHSALFKAESFGDLAEAAGWDVEFDNASDLDISVRAYRNGNVECISMNWVSSKRGSRLEFGEYSNADYTLSISNVSTAIERLEGEPLAKPLRGRARAAAENDEEAGNGLLGLDVRVLPLRLPFDFCEAYDDEIIDAVRGRTIVWWSELMTGYHFAQVWPERQRDIRITESRRNGQAILNFLSPEGFRAAYIKCIVQVK